MAEADVIAAELASPNGAELPTVVRVGGAPRLTPNELRVLKAQTGKTLEGLMSDEADAMQAMVWLRLRRLGHNPSWDAAGDIEADMSEEAPDPLPGGRTTTSPDSAASGG